MIMFSLFTIFSIVFIFLVFLVWKSKNWSKMKKAALSIILAAGLLVAVYASFGLILIFSDHAGYYTPGSNLGENVYFSTWNRDGGTDISFYNEDRPDTLAPFKPEDLPPDEWIVEKFRLMFDITEQESRDYLKQLKDSIGNNQETSGEIGIRNGL